LLPTGFFFDTTGDFFALIDDFFDTTATAGTPAKQYCDATVSGDVMTGDSDPTFRTPGETIVSSDPAVGTPTGNSDCHQRNNLCHQRNNLCHQRNNRTPGETVVLF